jgi:hypothetical protein
MPKKTPRALGSLCGVRSPDKYGRKNGDWRLKPGPWPIPPGAADRLHRSVARPSPARWRRSTSRTSGASGSAGSGKRHARRDRDSDETIGHHEQHARSAQRQERLPGETTPNPTALAALSPPPPGHDSRQLQFLRGGRGEARQRGSLDQARHVRRVRPVAASIRIGPVAPPTSSHPVPEASDMSLIFSPSASGARSPSAAARSPCCERSRLVARHPEQLRRGKSRHHDVAGDGARFGSRCSRSSIRAPSGRRSTGSPGAAADPAHPAAWRRASGRSSPPRAPRRAAPPAIRARR